MPDIAGHSIDCVARVPDALETGQYKHNTVTVRDIWQLNGLSLVFILDWW